MSNLTLFGYILPMVLLLLHFVWMMVNLKSLIKETKEEGLNVQAIPEYHMAKIVLGIEFVLAFIPALNIIAILVISSSKIMDSLEEDEEEDEQKEEVY